MKQDFHELIQRRLSGLLTEDEADALQSALRANADLRRVYLDYMNLDTALGSKAASADATRELLVTPPASPPPRWILWWSLPAAAAVVIVMLGIWVLKPSTKVTSSVATMLYAEGCEWQDGRIRMDGQRLDSGMLRLRRGLAILRFDGGAEMVLTGGTSLELVSRGSVRVERGQITVWVKKDCAGFRVDTPTSQLTDLGTEFEVHVGERGETELQVLDGEVSYAVPGLGSEDAPRVTAGKAMRFGGSEGSPSEIRFSAKPFAEVVRSVNMAPRDELLLAYEGFNYNEGALPLIRANGGKGWAGNWQVGRLARLPADNQGDMLIATDRLHAPWPMLGGRRGMLQIDGRFGSRSRKLRQPLRLDRDGIYYLSMMVRWEIPADKLDSKEIRFLRLALRSSADYPGDRMTLTLPAFLKPQAAP